MSGLSRAGREAARRVTPFQRRILGWIQDYSAAQGVGPAMHEVQDALSVSEVKCRMHLLALERAGFIRRRTIELVGVPRGGLSVAEAAWCEANAARVRAMMAISQVVS
jgi:SOS-response transcriptional repressor LexA